MMQVRSRGAPRSTLLAGRVQGHRMRVQRSAQWVWSVGLFVRSVRTIPHDLAVAPPGFCCGMGLRLLVFDAVVLEVGGFLGFGGPCLPCASAFRCCVASPVCLCSVSTTPNEPAKQPTKLFGDHETAHIFYFFFYLNVPLLFFPAAWLAGRCSSLLKRIKLK